MNGTNCRWQEYPTILITYKSYLKALMLYRRRGIKINPNNDISQLLNIENDEWYFYKGRILIFRKYHLIASFVIHGYKIYNPLIACGGYIDKLDMSWFRNITIKYFNDIDTLSILSRKSNNHFYYYL